MNLVVDTNIVFSTLLNPHSTIGDILMNVQDDVKFYAPELLMEELTRYREKIKTYTRLAPEELSLIETLVLSKITFISERSIHEQSWRQAFLYTENIDEADTPFVALAIEIGAQLWTGDKTLADALFHKGIRITISTSELKDLLTK